MIFTVHFVCVILSGFRLKVFLFVHINFRVINLT